MIDIWTFQADHFRHIVRVMSRLIAIVLLTMPVVAWSQPVPAAASDVPAVLTVPEGFGVSVFASGLTGARLMAVSPEGTLVVARRAEVVALPDADGDGVAEPRVLFSNMTYAHSVAFANGYLYIATTPAVLRVRWSNGAPVGQPEPIIELPSDKPSLHTSRTIRVGRDGRLYVTMGSSCNACVEPDQRRTTMMVFDADGRNGRTFATGLRNAVGFDWDPRTGQLWAGDPGIDGLGDDAPSEEINLVEEARNYGHPFYNSASKPTDLPELKGSSRPAVSTATAPAFELPAHTTPMGVAFYTGTRFPKAYRSSLYVALHGSTTRSTKAGYKVVRLVMENGRPVRSEDFVTGFLNGEAVSGRPVGLVTGADGALYVSDDNRGFVYRVFARPRPPGAAARELVTHAVPPLTGPTLQLQIVEVAYEPGGWSPSHHHPCPVVGYVLDGAVRMQLAGQPERVYKAGQTFTELPTDVHVVSSNASETAPARFLAYFACDTPGPRSVPTPHPGAAHVGLGAWGLGLGKTAEGDSPR
jgi:glucose/arabinose dehydrogenase/quercetin dioxygenase-like cupin family protein